MPKITTTLPDGTSFEGDTLEEIATQVDAHHAEHGYGDPAAAGEFVTAVDVPLLDGPHGDVPAPPDGPANPGVLAVLQGAPPAEL